MTDGGKEGKKIQLTEWERTEKNNEFHIIFCLSYRRLDFAGRKTSLWHVRVSPVSPDYRLSRSAYDKNHKFPRRGIILAVDDEWARRANMRATHILARGFPFIDFSNLAMWLSFRMATEEELECQSVKRCILTSGDSRIIFYLTFFFFYILGDRFDSAACCWFLNAIFKKCLCTVALVISLILIYSYFFLSNQNKRNIFSSFFNNCISR